MVRFSNGGKVIGVLNESKNDGVQIRQHVYSGKVFQQWRMQLKTDGYYQLATATSNKVF
jgi:hypothetical protein